MSNSPPPSGPGRPGGRRPDDTVDELLALHRLRRVDAVNAAACRDWLNDATQHVASAQAIAGVDPRGALGLCHAAIRKAITAHMQVNRLRPEAGEGSHRATVAYARERMADILDAGTLDGLELVREQRNASDYGDEPSRSVGPHQAKQAVAIAEAVVTATRRWIVPKLGPPRRH
jgi:hypothetical protein